MFVAVGVVGAAPIIRRLFLELEEVDFQIAFSTTRRDNFTDIGARLRQLHLPRRITIAQHRSDGADDQCVWISSADVAHESKIRVCEGDSGIAVMEIVGAEVDDDRLRLLGEVPRGG